MQQSRCPSAADRMGKSLASWSGGSSCEGSLFGGISRLFELAASGPIQKELFETDHKFADAISFLRNYGPITEIIPFLADM